MEIKRCSAADEMLTLTVKFDIQSGPKKASYFVVHPKVVFYNFFPYFSGGVDSRSKRFF